MRHRLSSILILSRDAYFFSTFSLALSREGHYLRSHPGAVDIGSNAPTLRLGESWPQGDVPLVQAHTHDAGQPTKKAKGFKKIWKIVTGTRSKSVDHSTNTRNQSMVSPTDDGPLAPPPPLSYLVNRERSGGGGSARRHVSTPSLPTANAVSPNVSSSYMPSPPTAPSSIVPSPTSSRPSGGDDTYRGNGQISSDAEDKLHSGDCTLPESDSRGRTTRSSSRTLSSFNGPLTPVSTSQRPMSTVVRRDKSLPPLPGEASVEFPSHPMPEMRPQTMFTYDPRTLAGYPEGLVPPQAAFRANDTRRQSFGGVSSRPHPAIQSLPVRGAAARGQVQVPPFLAEEKYSEFGASQMSLGQWPNAQKSQHSLRVPSDGKPKKRKSKFGLSSLFGKKSTGHSQAQDGLSDSNEYPSYRTSQSDSPYNSMTVNGTGYSSTPMSMHSGHVARPSVSSKKTIERLERVEQDREFVAYRYPSTEQPLTLMR